MLRVSLEESAGDVGTGGPDGEAARRGVRIAGIHQLLSESASAECVGHERVVEVELPILLPVRQGRFLAVQPDDKALPARIVLNVHRIGHDAPL